MGGELAWQDIRKSTDQSIHLSNIIKCLGELKSSFSQEKTSSIFYSVYFLLFNSKYINKKNPHSLPFLNGEGFADPLSLPAAVDWRVIGINFDAVIGGDRCTRPKCEKVKGLGEPSRGTRGARGIKMSSLNQFHIGMPASPLRLFSCSSVDRRAAPGSRWRLHEMLKIRRMITSSLFCLLRSLLFPLYT